MSDLFNADIVEVRRQYIQHLLAKTDTLSNGAGPDFHTLLTKLINKGLTYLEERVNSYLSRLLTVEGTGKDYVQTLVNDFIYLEEYLMQTYRNRVREGTSELSQTLPDPSPESTHKYIHQEVLTEVHRDFLDDVNLDSTNIMDRMIQDQLMTEDERESIVQEKTSRRRKEEFLLLMRGRLSYRTLVDSFIPAVGEDHPHVAGKIKTVIAEFQTAPSRSSVCVVCNMKDTIQVKHLAEHLHTNGLISAIIHEELRSVRMTNESKWSMLMSNISSWNLIAEAVKHTFPKVYDALRNENATHLACRCQAVNGKDLSLEDYSETTDLTLVPDVANLDDLESLLDASETESAVSTLKSLKVPYNIPEDEVKYQHSEVRQDNKQIGESGGVIVSTLVRQVQVEFPEGALTRPVVVGVKTQLMSPELLAKHFNNTDAVSPVITVEPRCRKVHKPITLTIPIHTLGLTKQDLYLLYNISGDKEPDVWKDITSTKPMRLHKDCVSFEAVVTAGYWVINSPKRNNIEQIATDVYTESVAGVYKPKCEVFEEDKREKHYQNAEATKNASSNFMDFATAPKGAYTNTERRNLTTKNASFTELSKNTDTLW